MSDVGQRERETQKRVVKLFDKDTKGFNLGYTYLGNFEKRENNSNIEKKYLIKWLEDQGVSSTLITKVLQKVEQFTSIPAGKKLYEINKAFYELLRYGVFEKEEIGSHNKQVFLIDWKTPSNNDFYIAEEVTINGEHEKRPDIVLYINGIALGVLELKRSTIPLSHAIRQNLDNHKEEFIKDFFTTMQLVMAGNDSQGLRYGTIETSERYYLTWKEENPGYNPEVDTKDKRYLPQDSCGEVEGLLDCAIVRLLNKEQFIEILHDFILYDAGTKKTCRPNQYFGVKALQRRVKKREGGILWHTQGSGKSITMVWLAKWLRENINSSRVLIITDRTELDEQIEQQFKDVDENDVYKTSSGKDLLGVLNVKDPWLICSLVHKFGANESMALKETNKYIDELKKSFSSDFKAKGELFVFVDECHRTQSGKLHKAMKELLPNAMFIGFTGTPLLKDDKAKSIEIFGSYIHTYKFDEAVEDGVILDLQYEARDIDQYIESQEEIDEWFEAETKDLSDMGKYKLQERWGTMQKVLSSKARLEKIKKDILHDMKTKPRLCDGGRGNAMLVCSSIYKACTIYEMFSKSKLKNRCAIITSYVPTIADIKGEETGEGETEAIEKYNIYRQMLADYFKEDANSAVKKIDTFESEVKQKFIKHPNQMKLLIVVDKLLTGFDAPSATYLYIDKSLRDHGLFQAICRVNRLDGEDKEYGVIIDYQDLFRKLEGAVEDYTGEAFDHYDKSDVVGLLVNRHEKIKEILENAIENIKALCEPVDEPKNEKDFRHYFVSKDGFLEEEAKANEPKRVALYKSVNALSRAYINVASEYKEVGYSDNEILQIKEEVKYYEDIKKIVSTASHDYVDMKLYEPGMRQLIDDYIGAKNSVKVEDFEELGIMKILLKGRKEEIDDDILEPVKDNKEAMSETIENNIRKIIIEENKLNPNYYEKMSKLLDEIIKERKENALEYEEYLKKVKELAKQTTDPYTYGTKEYPTTMDDRAKRNLYDNLQDNEEMVIKVDTIINMTKEDNWIGDINKENKIAGALYTQLKLSVEEIEKLMEIIKQQNAYK